MNEYVDIVLFGASVTEQNKQDSYFRKLDHLLRELNHSSSNLPIINLHRLSYASDHLGDAGLTNLDTVIALRPDFVVLEWLTTDEHATEKKIIDHIYRELSKRGIRTLTVSFLRADTWDEPSASYLNMLENAIALNHSFLDARSACDQVGLHWSDVTRDGVHSSTAGADLYAKMILDEVVRLLNDKKPRRTLHPKVEHDKLNLEGIGTSPIPTTSLNIGPELRVEYGQKLLVDIWTSGDGHDNHSRFAEAWCKQTVGPASPMVECSSRGVQFEKSSLLDRWCHYQRFATRPIFRRFPVGGNEVYRIEVSLSETDPIQELSQRDDRLKPVDPTDRVIRLHDRIVGVNCSILDVSVGI